MADDGSVKTRQHGLQQAASIIFALVAVVPLLIFAYTLNALGAIRSTQAQISLALALAISLLGFWMFRSMLGHMAEIVQALAAAVDQANRSRRAAGAPVAPAAGPVAVGRPAAGNSGASAPAVATAAAPVPVAIKKIAADRSVPGVGNIREIAEVARTMDVLWQREATAHVGKKVQISVANSREPLIGTITEVSDDGLILEQTDGVVAVAYRRVTAIDRLSGQA
jgi:hypothetical protein